MLPDMVAQTRTSSGETDATSDSLNPKDAAKNSPTNQHDGFNPPIGILDPEDGHPDTWPDANLLLGVSDEHLAKSEGGASSFIQDAGDANQLINEQDPARSEGPIDHLVSHAGSGLSLASLLGPVRHPDHIHYGYDRPFWDGIPLQKSGEFGSRSEDPLGVAIRSAMSNAHHAQDRNAEFLPMDKLDMIITPVNILEELRWLRIGEREDQESITLEIWGTFKKEGKKPTTRRKLFAILVMLEKLQTILDFISEGLYDSDLPFTLHKDSTISRQDARTIEAFQRSDWRINQKDQFTTYQWKVHVPYFDLSYEAQPKVPHYLLEDQTLLPLVGHHSSSEQPPWNRGGFSVVRKVKFHPAHYNSKHWRTPSEQNPSFAIKSLQFGRTKIVAHGDWRKQIQKAFLKEVANLKRINNEQNDHLIRLLFTFEQRDEYHMVFPWANGNLKDYWQNFPPDHLLPSQSCEFARWMSRQCLGLARGLQKIHYSSANPSKAEPQGVGDETPMKRYGRHGDIKPENILWFQNDGTESSNKGILKICDFGFSDFHGSVSKARFDLEGVTITYRSPESVARNYVSKEDDIWSLGCVLLEFVVWSLLGWDGVDEFSQERADDSTTINFTLADDFFALDDFFNFTERSPEGKKAESKQSVQKKIKALQNHEHCSDFLLEMLVCIEENMLRIHENLRASCDVIVQRFEEIDEACQKSSKYCTERLKKLPERQDTGHSEVAFISSPPIHSIHGGKETLCMPVVARPHPGFAYANVLPNDQNSDQRQHLQEESWPEESIKDTIVHESPLLSQANQISSTQALAIEQPDKAASADSSVEKLDKGKSGRRKWTHFLIRFPCFGNVR